MGRMGSPGSFLVVWVVFRYARSSLVFLEKIEVILQWVIIMISTIKMSYSVISCL